MAFQIKCDVRFHKCYESRLPRRNNVTVHHEISDFSGVSVELTVFNNCKNNNYYYIITFLNSSLYFWTERFDSVVMVQLSYLVQSYVSSYRSEQLKFGCICSALTQK